MVSVHSSKIPEKLVGVQRWSKDCGNGQPKPVKLETHPMGKHQSLTLLMILCYACRQESSVALLRGSIKQLIQTDGDTDSQTVYGA